MLFCRLGVPSVSTYVVLSVLRRLKAFGYGYRGIGYSLVKAAAKAPQYMQITHRELQLDVGLARCP